MQPHKPHKPQRAPDVKFVYQVGLLMIFFCLISFKVLVHYCALRSVYYLVLVIPSERPEFKMPATWPKWLRTIKF